MKFNKTTRSRSLDVATRKAKFSDRIPSFTTPRHDRPKNQQGARNVLAGSLHCMALLLSALLIVSLWASPSVAEDNDYPHNFVQNASCNTGTCHSAYGGGAGPDYKLGDISCLFCHDGTDPAGSLTAPTVVGHSSATTSTKYGTWAMKCIDCHHEHLQAQYWAYGEDSYVVSGISDAGGITENTLTMTAAGWEENSLAGMVLFPNVEDLYADWSNYGIIGNTADTITVKGPMLLDGGGWDTPIGTGNKRFAVTYGKAISHIVPDEPGNGGLTQKPVRFFRSEGANSFADGDATYDGICEACHTKTSHHRNNGAAPYQSHFNGSRCTTCHPHDNGFKPVAFDHTAGGAVMAVSPCLECHDGPDPVGDVHGNQCGLCHVAPGGGGPLVEPYESTAPQGGNCIDCHGSAAAVHDADHTAAPGSGSVVIFPDNGHDDAGWVGSKPYFDVTVDCTLCHDTNLITIHGSNCATCHPSPRNTLAPWNGGCQQGGCHAAFHEGSATAHSPFEDTSGGTVNDCSRCHTGSNVPQSNCLNCHATNASGDTTPPVTTANALAVYNGPARIDFTITDNGKVGVGTTFYKLDGGPVTAGSHVLASTAGSHTLEFWSVDQAGNVEAPPKIVSFEVVLDTTPPTTTTNAQAAYNQGSAVITLTATDDSTQGVKNTYFRLNGGPVQTGTTVTVGTNGSYTLTFWSEDWAGNIETQKTVSFTVASGPGTLRLVWGNSDVDVSQAPTGDDWAGWTIRKGTRWGTVVASGSSDTSPNWNGVNDINLPVSTTPYFVIIFTWSDEEDDEVWIPNVYVTTPGQVVRLSY